MQITASALSLNVADPAASAAFATDHLGFTEAMAADGFVSLEREDAGFNLVFLRHGPGVVSSRPRSLGHDADGLLVAFVVDDVDAEYERLQREGVGDHDADRDRAVGRALLPGDRPQRGGHPARPWCGSRPSRRDRRR